jgi:hypothetical protein
LVNYHDKYAYFLSILQLEIWLFLRMHYGKKDRDPPTNRQGNDYGETVIDLVQKLF